MTDLKSLLPEELETFFGAMGESAYRGRSFNGSTKRTFRILRR